MTSLSLDSRAVSSRAVWTTPYPSPEKCLFLPWQTKSVDQVANIGANRANSPN